MIGNKMVCWWKDIVGRESSRSIGPEAGVCRHVRDSWTREPACFRVEGNSARLIGSPDLEEVCFLGRLIRQTCGWPRGASEPLGGFAVI